MNLSDLQIKAINDEYLQWKDKMYADRTLSERKDFGQFFTPPNLTIKMLEKFDNFDDTILDPCCGAGNLLAAAIKVGFKPENVYGIEIDPTIMQIAVDRLSLLGVPNKNIKLGDALNPLSYDFD
jgi:site-specific DNA-methyltransferase (adenine-specific)